MAIVISGNGIDMGNNPVSNASQIEVQENQVSPYNGFKNYIINGKKVINQRGLTSTNNSYNQDRWYKAGNNWYQGIEGANNLISGKTYTLSWEGDATASYYVGTATSATINSQTFTAIDKGESFTLTISAGENLWIKFASDATGSTFNFVQLEEGSVATPFEQRPIGLELSLCQRYYETSYLNGTTAGTISYYDGAITGGHYYNNSSGPSGVGVIKFSYKTEKRVNPTTLIYNPATGALNSVVDSGNRAASVFSSFKNELTVTYYGNGGSIGRVHYTADAEL